ncbi:L-2-hydroxyglutarate oxidase [Kineosporia sp. R_H_3]|uniref:L-2-hydroxyglutarate oxidase n=1 Tax=Kineosporia sp. R_H_3 TaxID=1961848 RepID=UPI000B4B61BE|nr:L-2-hydroxyglutarate oxidase [Kineosporia sp. R_H_3]
MERIGVVGAGIVGLAVARRVTQLRPDAVVTVLDKEDRVAAHQTGHNSGVVHAGLYYAPGSLKATLCRRGVGLLREFCAEHALPFEEAGKLVVAVDESELPALERIRERAVANAVPDLRPLDAAGLRDVEPHAAGVAALHSPRTAITDFVAVTAALGRDVEAAGGRVLLGREVTAVERTGPTREQVTVTTRRSGLSRADDGERFTFDRLVVCAGLQSDVVARRAGDDAAPAIVPFRGEYWTLRPERTSLVRGLIYPVPDPAYPFLGVHFTRRVDGRVDVGPNAVLALAREGYRRRDVALRDLGSTLAWPGFRSMARSHWRMGLGEMAGSASRTLFMRRARRYVPEVTAADVVPAPAGVRAQAVDRDGGLVDDFRISDLGPVLAVRNAPSPAATSSLAIAEHVVAMLLGTAPRPV